MTTPHDLQDKVTDSVAEFHGMMTKLNRRNQLAPIIRSIQAPQGYVNIADVYPVGEMEDAKAGEKATVHGVEAEELKIKVKGRRWTGELDYETWIQGDARSQGQFTRAAQMSVMQIAVDKRNRIISMLNDGATLTDIFDTTEAGGTKSAIFRGGTLSAIVGGTADFKYIPQSGKRFANLVEGAYTNDTGETRAGIEAALEAMDYMENSIGGIMHIPPEEGARFRVYGPPGMRSRLSDAIAEGPGADEVGSRKYQVDYEIVSGLDNTSPGTAGAAFYVARLDEMLQPFVEIQRGPEEYRTLFSPDNIHQILFNGGLFQPYYAYGYGPGSTFNIVKVRDNSGE